VAQTLERPVAILDADGELVAAAGLQAGEALGAVADGAVRAGATTGIGSERRPCQFTPIRAMGRRYGVICVLDVDGDDTFARAAAAQAAVVAGMQFVGRREVEAVHRRFEHELLDELADNRLRAREARELAAVVGWPLRRPHLLLVAGRQPPEPRSAVRSIAFRLADADANALAQRLRVADVETRTFRRADSLAVVVHLGRDGDAAAAVGEVVDVLARTRGVPWTEQELVFGVSRPRRDVVELPRGYREAMLALLTAPSLRRRETRVARFDDLGAMRLLAQVDDAGLADRAAATLGPLADPDLPGRQDLLSTLEALLVHNMHLAAAAEDVFFHYNTVRHRLARLRDLLGPRLDSPRGRLGLSLALGALRLIEVDRVAALGHGRARAPSGPAQRHPTGRLFLRGP
jgi:purine catabolism regulator